MLEELIKLSKELFEMELVKESLEIDGLIHKLYGVGGDIDAPVLREADDTVLYSESQSLSEDLRYLLTASKEEEFRQDIPSILIESLDHNDLMLIKEAITEYLD